MQLKATYKDIWKIGYPVMIGNMAHGITQAIDYAFMGRVGINDLNGTLMAGMAFFFLIMIALGFTGGAQIVIARRTGELNYKGVGKTFDHLLYKGALLAIFIFAATVFFKNTGLDLMLKSDEIVEKAAIYLSYRQWSVPLIVLNLTLIAFYTGIGKTKVVTVCTVIMSLTNLVFDYGLIFGNLGLPEMGIAGASLATVFAEIIGSITLFAALIINKDIKRFNLFTFPKIDWTLMGRMLNLSTPIVFQHLIALGTWWLFFIMIEKMGEAELAISGVIKSLYMLIGIPLWGFASAIKTIVSNLIGQKKIEDVIPATIKSIHISFTISFLLSSILFLFPKFFLGLYTDDITIVEKAVPTLHVILLVMLSFSVGVMTMHAVMGIGDTKTLLIIEAICITSYIVYSYLAIFVWHFSLPNVWKVEFIYWILMPVLTIAYLANNKWKTKVFDF
ncbi:MAG: MATE family efflux transporter [Chitinophagales bacterium]